MPLYCALYQQYRECPSPQVAGDASLQLTTDPRQLPNAGDDVRVTHDGAIAEGNVAVVTYNPVAWTRKQVSLRAASSLLQDL